MQSGEGKGLRLDFSEATRRRTTFGGDGKNNYIIPSAGKNGLAFATRIRVLKQD
jgi:hypothetical protein